MACLVSGGVGFRMLLFTFVRSMLYIERFYYGNAKPMFGMRNGNSVETMAYLVSGGVGCERFLFTDGMP
ncbi:MAG: hypothetical protein WCP97_05360 [bacterium]